jgi:hypothetical protein
VPPVPPGCEPLWGAFAELSAARPTGGAGVAAITFSEVVAWQQAFGVKLTPWEIETLLALDRVAVGVMSGG